MAAMSTVQTATTLTPPSSSHDNGSGNGYSWDFTSTKPENQHHYASKNTLKLDTTNGSYRAPLTAQHGNSSAYSLDTSTKASNGGDQVSGSGAMSRSYSDPDSDSLDDRPDNVVDEPFEDDYDRIGRSGYQPNGAEDSKWIHRDKLVKIENEELQAAGLVLPQPRSRSRPSRDRSQSSTKRLHLDNSTRSRKNSSHALEPITPDAAEARNGWDSDVGAEAEAPAKPAGGSRIPVPKKSPLPLPTQHQERDRHFRRGDSPDEMEKPKARSRSNSATLKTLEGTPNPKVQPGKRAATTTDAAPKKPTPTGPRKGLPASKTIPPEARGKVKPKGKNGANGNSTRPSTRSGDRELSSGSLGSKPMEGDPPWMVSAYKPDPRLPPDQQLLPTVARRLQQEKWEQEGKFGTVYDKDFRPLTDEGFLTPPANMPSSSSSDDNDNNDNNDDDNNDNVVKQEVEKPSEDWPLKSPEAPKSPNPARMSSYSTMPKVQDRPNADPLPSPRAPTLPINPSEPTQITRVPDIPEKEETGKKEKGGCACCIVM